MKERDPQKDQHPEGLIWVGLIVLGAFLIGFIFAIACLFDSILRDL